MKLGMVGLGRMGAGMTRRLLEGGHQVVGFDPSAAAVSAMTADGAEGAESLGDLVAKLSAPKVVWLMIPSGAPVDESIARLTPMLSKGDIIVDGGNSNYHDTVARGKKLAESGISFLDVGTSGGIWGLKVGFCMMIGGNKAAFDIVEPAIKTLAPPEGYAYIGPSGSGHFVKMVHNGIEYGMMQAYGEGFEIIERSEYDVDLAKLAHIWGRGSVIRSWLLELAEDALTHDPKLSSLEAIIDDTGEGRWTSLEAIQRAVPAPVITAALIARFQSRDRESFGAKLVAALRNEFGGHAIHPAEEA